MFANLTQDTRRLREIKSKPYPFYVLESLLFENGYQAVVMHRIAHWFRRRGIPLFGPLVARVSLLLTGVDIAPEAVIGPGLRIAHGVGLVIGNKARLGARATLLHQVTIGAPSTRRITEMPQLGDDVFVAAGARLIGGITIGDRVFIGANTVLTRDVPSDAKVATAAEPRIDVRTPTAES
ncbi:MAG: DapH/DapD/GlmU-related protein [Acidobacteria bacterium]|nr:DapH/DapD/GlmU-related protein [Acidobacteriota bacterium]